MRKQICIPPDSKYSMKVYIFASAPLIINTHGLVIGLKSTLKCSSLPGTHMRSTEHQRCQSLRQNWGRGLGHVRRVLGSISGQVTSGYVAV